jgi:predicted nucleic-acid-binding protein
MIAADTNVVVRHLTHDDPAQTALVERLFADAEVRGEPVFLSHVVLCELCWTLASVYRMPKAAVVAALEALLDDRAFLIQERGQVEEALTSFRRGPADFSDYLLGVVASRAGAKTTFTFDRKVARASAFTLVK